MHSIRTKFVLTAVMIAVVTSLVSLPAAILYFERRLDGLDPRTRATVESAIELNAAQDFDGLAELLLAMSVTAGVGIVAGLLLTRRHTRTIRAISDAAARLSTGDLTARTSPEQRRWHDEADDLATAFDSMAADIERLERDRVATSAAIAHELRTPLAVLRARLQGQIDGVLEGTDHEVRILLEQTILLDRLIEDLRVLSLHTAGRLEIRRVPTDLSSLIESVASAMSTGERVIDVDVPTGTVIDCDPDRMRQVITNLVTNAQRHGPHNATITISAHADDSTVSIHVEDSSPTPRTSTVPAGTGLGLSIVASLVAAHGGTFHLEPNDLNGSTATIRLTTREPTTLRNAQLNDVLMPASDLRSGE